MGRSVCCKFIVQIYSESQTHMDWTEVNCRKGLFAIDVSEQFISC